MANYATLKAAIDQVIKANGQQDITGPVMNQVLKVIVDGVGAGYNFAGVATPQTNPGSPDGSCFWIGGKGSYTNFGASTVNVLSGYLGVFMWDGSAFTSSVLKIGGSGGAFDVTDYTGQQYATLAAAVAAVPVAERSGGMSIMYVQSSDNKYVQYRYMGTSTAAADFTNVANWQGVDDKPTTGSKNLVESGSVYESQKPFLRTGYAVTKDVIDKVEISDIEYNSIFGTSFTGYNTYGYVEISQLFTYYISFKGEFSSTRVCLKFYDENYQVIGNITGDKVQPNIIYKIYPPAGARYIKYADAASGIESHGLYNTQGYLYDSVNADRFTFYESLIGKYIRKQESEIVGRQYINSAGNLASGTSGYKVNKIDVSSNVGELVVLYSGANNSMAYAYTIHDENGNVLAHANANVTVKKDYLVEIPSNAKYLYVQNASYIYITSKAELYQLIESIKTSVTATLNALVSLEDMTSDIEGGVSEVKKYINRNGNISTGTSSFNVTKYDIELLLSGTISISSSSNNSNASAYAVHDKNGNVLKVANVNTTVQRDFSFLLEDCPGAKYLYVQNVNYARITQKGEVANIIKLLLSVSEIQNEQGDRIDEQVSKVFTNNNNILWLGTSIPHGSTYPANASKKCGYNCTNNSVSASRLTTWPGGVKPATITSTTLKTLTATVNELETMFREDVTAGTITESELETAKNQCYERSVIPYIDGTNETQVSMIVIDHGFNDANNIAQLMADKDNIDWDSRDRSNFVGAFNYLMDKIQEASPFVKIVICGYFQNSYAPHHSKDICDLQALLAERYGISIMKVWEHSQINTYYVAGTNNYLADFNTQYGTSYTKQSPDINGNIMSLQLYCPDMVHPYKDLTGNCNKRLDAVVSKLLKDLL